MGNKTEGVIGELAVRRREATPVVAEGQGSTRGS
jgi:hypothetical protein